MIAFATRTGATCRLTASALDFYGVASFAVDTTKPFTLVTQFVTEDGTDATPLVEIRRHHRQGGKSIPTPSAAVALRGHFDSLDAYCDAETTLFGSNTTFAEKGGLGTTALQRPRDGLVLSLWDDYLSHMLWLDSTDPPGSTKPGAARGPCPPDSGDPAKIEPGSKAYALFSNIRFGEIGSTDAVFPPAPPMPPSPPPPPLCAKPYAQCGGKLPSGKPWPGPMCCPLGYHCTGNDYYKGCSPDADQAGDDDERRDAGERVASHREPPRFTTYHSKAYGR